MKNLKLILFLSFLILIQKNLLAQYGEQIRIEEQNFNNSNISNLSYDVQVYALTIPFEGFNNPDSNNNRYDTIHYGAYQLRRYTKYAFNGQPLYDTSLIGPLTYFYGNNYDHNSRVNFAHCSALPGSIMYEPGSNLYLHQLLGYAKYQFIVKVNYNIGINNFEKLFKWTIDFTDSDYGKLNYSSFGGNYYLSRWKFRFDCIEKKFKLYNFNTNQFYEDIEAITGVSTGPDFKIWELTTRNTSYHRTVPFAENFYIRNIPFPLPGSLTLDTLREVSLNTYAIIDTILPYSYYKGYNTNPVYYNQSNNGKILTSPGTVVTKHLPNPQISQYEWGSKINILQKGNLKIKNGIEFRICNFDTLNCTDNSVISLNQQSKLTTGLVTSIDYDDNGHLLNSHGTILLNNSIINGDGSGIINIKYSGILIVSGDSKIINTSLILDSLSQLYILDNSTLIIDSNQASLLLKPGANIYLGQNSKILIKNYSKLTATNISFNSTNNQIWNGIEFENAGNGSLIKNCTFSNSINPIKIVNNSSAAHNEIRIENNTFNLPNNAQNGISAENVFNLLIQDNTINGNNAQNLVYIKNSINPIPQEESPATYNLALVRNNFYGGNRQVYFDCNASGNTPVFVYKNKFNSFTGSLAFIGRKIR